jgi:hypothetical protein
MPWGTHFPCAQQERVNDPGPVQARYLCCASEDGDCAYYLPRTATSVRRKTSILPPVRCCPHSHHTAITFHILKARCYRFRKLSELYLTATSGYRLIHIDEAEITGRKVQDSIKPNVSGYLRARPEDHETAAGVLS